MRAQPVDLAAHMRQKEVRDRCQREMESFRRRHAGELSGRQGKRTRALLLDGARTRYVTGEIDLPQFESYVEHVLTRWSAAT